MWLLGSFQEEVQRDRKICQRSCKKKISLAVEALNQINQLYDIEDDLKGRPPEDIRPFCVGKKNWVMIDTVSGAEASAVIYSLTETTKANDLNPYEYFKYLLEEAMAHIDDTSLDFLEDLLPWSKTLPDNCTSRQDESNTDTQNNTNAQD